MDTVLGPTGKEAGQERKFRVFSFNPSKSPACNQGCIHKVSLQRGLKSGVLNLRFHQIPLFLTKSPNSAQWTSLRCITKTSRKWQECKPDGRLYLPGMEEPPPVSCCNTRHSNPCAGWCSCFIRGESYPGQSKREGSKRIKVTFFPPLELI